MTSKNNHSWSGERPSTTVRDWRSIQHPALRDHHHSYTIDGRFHVTRKRGSLWSALSRKNSIKKKKKKIYEGVSQNNKGKLFILILITRLKWSIYYVLDTKINYSNISTNIDIAEPLIPVTLNTL